MKTSSRIVAASGLAVALVLSLIASVQAAELQVLAGGAMYAMVTVGRTFLASAPNGYRLPGLILIGAATQ